MAPALSTIAFLPIERKHPPPASYTLKMASATYGNRM
jgi:hypothetical protein